MKKALDYIFSGKEKRYLVYLLIIIIIGSFLELLGVSAFMPFITLIMDPESLHDSLYLEWFYTKFRFSNTTDFLASLAGMIILVYILKNLYLIWEKNTIYKFAYKLQKNTSVRLLTAYLHEPYTFYLNKNPAELIRSLENDTDLFAKAIIHTLELLSEILICIVLGIYLFMVSHSITIIVMIILIFSVTVFTSISKRLSTDMGRQGQEYNGKAIQYINQSLGGIKEIKILNREDYFESAYANVEGKYVRTLRVTRLMSVVPKYVMEAACIGGLLVAVIMKMYFGQNDLQAFIPQMSVFAVAAFRMLPSVGRINEHSTAIFNAYPSIELVYNDLQAVENAPVIRDKVTSAEWQFQNDISIMHVSFHYPDTDDDVLHDVSFDIPKGKTVAFIGTSGAGKTTMADIILGLLIPQRGHIEADGLNIMENIHIWQKEIGYIPQNIYLSDDTIRNNIAFGIENDEISDEAVIDAATRAQLKEFVDTLTEGFNTVVGDRGARLSGGQRQRIGIARALYYDPEVLVLDEATSALDNETETAVMESVDRLKGEKTIIIIAHRLTTIRNADIIYEVDNKQVVERNKEEILRGL